MQTMRAKTRGVFTMCLNQSHQSHCGGTLSRGLRDSPWAQWTCPRREYWQEAIPNWN